MTVLISGAGIAGATLAYWLAEYGFTVTLVEKAPAPRTGGYVIDFWGAGYDVAERMAVLPEVKRAGYTVEEVRVVNGRGRCVASLSASAFVRAARGRYVSVPRGELAAILLKAAEGRVTTRFGESVASMEQCDSCVHVAFESGAEADFDLVIGADGLHSRVRSLVFGPEARFELFLGIVAAAFQSDGYPLRDENAYVMYSQVGRQVARFSMRGGRTMFLLTFAEDVSDARTPEAVCAQKALLHERFGDSGWECPQILDAMDREEELYFDRVSQIRMPGEQGRWTRGRVSLVGDTAFCVSLLGGQGSALAMAAAYILAGELSLARGDYSVGFVHYESRFAQFVERKQRAAVRFAGAFAPKSRLALYGRNLVMNLLTIDWLADLVIGRDLTDRIDLPEYGAQSQVSGQ